MPSNVSHHANRWHFSSPFPLCWRCSAFGKFITDCSKLTIINTSEVCISGPDDYDIVIDLENRIDEFEALKPFISIIARNISKIDNMVQEYNRLHCRDSQFDFDLTVIYFHKPNVIKLDYWGTRINTQFTVTFEFTGNEFVMKSFDRMNDIHSDWSNETPSSSYTDRSIDSYSKHCISERLESKL